MDDFVGSALHRLKADNKGQREALELSHSKEAPCVIIWLLMNPESAFAFYARAAMLDYREEVKAGCRWIPFWRENGFFF